MKTFSVIAICALVCSAYADPTVTLTLQSSKAGQTVTPGTTIDWTIKVAVSTGDNQGLALISTDLVQDASNPAPFDLPPGDIASVDATMLQFSRPLGISNPGEGGATTGYIGVQRGTAGQRNLKQIGGGQNTFGASGGTMGTDFNVQGGIGQSGQQTVLAGSFAAPATAGTYTFRLQNGIANVLTAVNPAPAFSPVRSAVVNTTGASFTITVQTGPVRCAGDSNCDGRVNFSDIDLFVAAIPDNQTAWTSLFESRYGHAPTCPFLNNDCNNDGHVNFSDIDPFVALIPSVCP